MEKHYIYYFTNANDEIIYVGRTNNMNRRMNQHFGMRGHLSEEAYNEVEFIYYSDELPRNEIAIYEIYYISKWKPKHNVTYNNNSVLQIELPSLEFEAFDYFGANELRDKALVETRLDQFKVRVEEKLMELERIWLPQIAFCGLLDEDIHENYRLTKSDLSRMKWSESRLSVVRAEIEMAFEEIKNL